VGSLPDDLYDYLQPAVRRRGRPAKKDRSGWTVTDDWPAEVPITEAEIEVFEAWFGDLFDELFSTRHRPLGFGDRHDDAGSCSPLPASLDRPASRQRSSIPDQHHQARDIAHRAAGRLLPTRSSPAFPRRTIADRNSSA
jgi:hypothetical protein